MLVESLAPKHESTRRVQDEYGYGLGFPRDTLVIPPRLDRDWTVIGPMLLRNWSMFDVFQTKQNAIFYIGNAEKLHLLSKILQFIW